MTRFVRLLIFLGYAVGAGAIFYGFFFMNWRELGQYQRGYEFARLTLDQFNSTLFLQADTQLSLDLLRNTGGEVGRIIGEFWPTVAVFAVVFIGIAHASSAIAAFVVFIIGRPLYPHKRFGVAFAIIGILITILSNVIIPVFILIQFYNRFLAEQIVGAGFWVTLFGVVIAGLTGPFVEFMRLFIQHPVNRPQRVKKSLFDESEIGVGYFKDPADDQPRRKKPIAEQFNHPYYKSEE